MHELKQYYDSIYDNMEEIPRTNKLYALSCIPKSGTLKVIDIGCGTGMNSQVIRSYGHSVIGIDISESAINKYVAKGFEGYTMDIEKSISFSPNSFDLAFCSEVIEHCTNPLFVLKDIFRILKPGGKLVLSTPNSAFWAYRLFSLLGYTVSELQHPKHFSFFSKRSLNCIINESGFKITAAMGRNMYIILPRVTSVILRRIYKLLGFIEERRFVTNSSFWHVSNLSKYLNNFFADTFIFIIEKPNTTLSSKSAS